jgi:hypothetical protein
MPKMQKVKNFPEVSRFRVSLGGCGSADLWTNPKLRHDRERVGIKASE